MYLWNYCSKIYSINMKHHKKQFSSSQQQKTAVFGNATAMIGKNILTLTFNIEVANQLDLKHNESLIYEIVNNRLVVRKKEKEF
jgi:glutamine cyclotransferase